MEILAKGGIFDIEPEEIKAIEGKFLIIGRKR
jgi:hypothetical protein